MRNWSEGLKQLLYIVIVLFLAACSEHESSSEVVRKEGTVKIEEVISIDTNLKPNEILVVDTIPVNTVVNYPLLVIENCAALWPLKCSSETILNSDSIISEVKSFFEEDSLISIGGNGMLNQSISEVFCIKGECGASQVALKLSNKECLGVLASRNIIQESATYSNLERIVLNLNQGKSDSLRSTHEKKGVIGYETYRDVSDSTFVWVEGFGDFQENGWPWYTSIHWKVSHYQQGVCYSAHGEVLNTTNMPLPIGIVSTKDKLKIIWYHGEGICCPSHSKAWVSEMDLTEGKRIIPIESEKQQGGFGQPCD